MISVSIDTLPDSIADTLHIAGLAQGGKFPTVTTISGATETPLTFFGLHPDAFVASDGKLYTNLASNVVISHADYRTVEAFAAHMHGFVQYAAENLKVEVPSFQPSLKSAYIIAEAFYDFTRDGSISPSRIETAADAWQSIDCDLCYALRCDNAQREKLAAILGLRRYIVYRHPQTKRAELYAAKVN